MSRLRIGLDVDGVLYDFFNCALDHVNRTLGTSFNEDQQTDYSFTRSFGGDVGPVFYKFMGTEECWVSGKPYPGALELAQRLAKVSDIYIITHIGPTYAAARESWLARNGFPFVRFIDAAEKYREVQRYALDAMIDDKYENCLDVAEKCYTPAFMVARKWNEGKPKHPLITRGPLEQAVEAIEKIASVIGDPDPLPYTVGAPVSR